VLAGVTAVVAEVLVKMVLDTVAVAETVVLAVLVVD
jgi:hypothetical protein